MKRVLKWERVVDNLIPTWRSTDGRYGVWEQARPRESGVWYGARCVAEKRWLTESAPLREAKIRCEEHAQGIIESTILRYKR